MGRAIDRVEDGSAFEGCNERMRTWVDHSHAANAFCKGHGVVMFFTALMGSDL
jgi:hypothetical protein